MNKREFKFVGMSRSGNHAIINWVIQQLKGRYCFLNCVEPKYNPFLTARPLREGGKTYKTNIPSFDLQQERSGRLTDKDYLLYSYEDCFLGSVTHEIFNKNREDWLGKTTEHKTLLILRDPFNLFASRIKTGILLGHYSPGAKPISIYNLKRIYKQHCKEFLGEKIHLENKIPVNYNRWIENKEYRKSIAEKLNISFTDEGFKEVSKVAGGSSFDRTKYAGNAHKMDLGSRWENYVDDKQYWELFDDELVDFTIKIFGEIPPVKYFHKLKAT